MITLYPTDTIFGLGVPATDPQALLALVELKGREPGKAFPVIVADMAMAREYAQMTPMAERLAAKFWPGKLTLVMQGKNLPPELLAPDGSVGIRIPNHEIALGLIREAGKPITATSANIAGQKTGSTVTEILTQFGDKSAGIFYKPEWPETLPPSEPSTVVDVRGEVPVFIREGAISKVAILEALG